MKVQKGISHHWWTQGGQIVKATAEPSTEERLVVVALDATAKALEPTQGKKLVIDWFRDERSVPNTPTPIGRLDERKP